MAFAALEQVRIGVARLRDEGCAQAASDPATRALELSPERRLKIARSLDREARRIKRRLILTLALLYLQSLSLKAQYALTKVVCDLDRRLPQLLGRFPHSPLP